MNSRQHARQSNQNPDRQLKKQIASIFMSFEDVMQSYSNNRKDLDQMLSQLLKAYRTIKIYKHSNLTINAHTNPQDLYFQFCLLNNIACCYSTKKQNHKSCEYLKLADKQLKFIQELLQKSELDYQSRKLQTIKVHMRMVRIKLQLCGVYALNIKHHQSLNQSSQSFGLLESVISSICDYSMGEKHNSHFLQLMKCVTQPNTEISQKEIKNCYWNSVMSCQSDEEVRNIFLGIFKNFHSKEQTQARSCLGKIISKNQQKNQTTSSESRRYLKEFSIGLIMKITPIMLQEFTKSKKKDDYISLKFLHQLTILLGLTHFTVSTQLRLGSMYDMESATVESFTAEQQFNNMKKQKKIIEAERHHFFAIEIIYKMATPYIKECPFFARLIKGYQEAYILKDNFEMIPEKVEEQNEISLLSVKQRPNMYDYRQQEDYYLKKLKDSKCETPRSAAKRQLRANLYNKLKNHKEEDTKNPRKTPSTTKSSQIHSPKPHLKTALSKSRDKNIKQIKSKGKIDRVVSPNMKKSRNQCKKSAHKDYSNY